MTEEQKCELLEIADDLVDRANQILLMIKAGFVAGYMDTSPLKDKPAKASGNVVSVDFGGEK